MYSNLKEIHCVRIAFMPSLRCIPLETSEVSQRQSYAVKMWEHSMSILVSRGYIKHNYDFRDYVVKLKLKSKKYLKHIFMIS